MPITRLPSEVRWRRVVPVDSPYRFEPARLDRAELAKTADLLQLVFPHARHLTADYLQWRYADNPDGPVVGCNAWLGDTIVGHMAASPMRALTDGGEQRGIATQNGAIHPEHRGKRLQSGISEQMFADGIAQRFAFSLATGNRYSTGPLSTRYQMVCPIDVHLGLGTPRRRKLAFIPSFETLWSADALQWRLSDPHRRYAIRNGRMLAKTSVPGIAAVLAEGLDLPDSGDAPSGPLRLYLGLDPGAKWAGSAFISIPQRLRPSPLNVMWRDLAGAAPMPDASRMIYRLLDTDLY